MMFRKPDLKSFLKLLGKKTAYITSAIIISVAFLVLLAFVLTPLLDKRRTQFETQASNYLHMPVSIGKVAVSWYHYQPVIRLSNVTILNKATHDPALQLDKVMLFFSIPKSIWQHQPILSGLLISGANINLKQNQSGEVSVQGFPTLGGAQPYKEETKFTDMYLWLSSQSRLILRDIDIHYSGLHQQDRFVSLYDLHIQNAGDNHVVFGRALLHQNVPTEINGVFQWHGNEPDLGKIKGKLYVYVSGLSLSQWLKDVEWKHWHVDKGLASAKIWANWDEGQFTKIQSLYQLYDLKLISTQTNQSHEITRMSGNVGWQQAGDQQIFAGEDILIDLPHHLWPVTSFYSVMNKNAQGEYRPSILNVGYADLEDVQSYLFNSGLLTAQNQDKLVRLKLKGSVNNLSIKFGNDWQAWQQANLTTNFTKLGLAPIAQWPGFANLSGQWTWDKDHGVLTLNSNRFVLNNPTLFNHYLYLDDLTGKATITLGQANDWKLEIANMHANNSDTTVDVSGLVKADNQKNVITDLNADFSLQDVGRINRYFPEKILSPALYKWLNGAFLGGEMKSGHMILQGDLKDFPFQAGNGKFEATAVLNNVDLHYAPDWPALKNINGKVLFSGNRLQINADSAQTLNVKLPAIEAVIPNLASSEAILTVKSVGIKNNFTEGLQFIQATPLKNSLGKMLAPLAMSGPFALDLNLTVPLMTNQATKVLGQMSFQDASLNLVPWDLSLQHLNGGLAFTEDTITANNIQGSFFGKPLKLSLMPGKSSGIQAILQTELNAADLESWLKLPVTKTIQGTAPAQFNIAFGNNIPINIKIDSNLVGMQVDLPDQFAKPANVARNFSADINIADQSPIRMKLTYGELLKAALILSKEKQKFGIQAADIKLGKGDVSWPTEDGISFTGNFDVLSWAKIKSYIGDANASDISNFKLQKIAVITKKFDMGFQTFHDMRLVVTPEKAGWNVDIHSPEIMGEIRLPSKFNRNQLFEAQFDKLELNPDIKTTTNLPSVDVMQLPEIIIRADDFSYKDMPIGKVSLNAVPDETGLAIEKFRISSPLVDLRSTGAWTKTETDINGVIYTDDLSELLDNYGFDVHNFISNKATAEFSLSWHGAPYAFNTASMSGNVHLNLGRGRVAEVGEQNSAKMSLGRLLNIFSLQAIPKRLALDFRDVYQKGYTFDSIRGDFNLKNGDAYTSNLRIEGAVASASIVGRIGLQRKDLDITLSITPHITSSVPVAAAVLTPFAPFVALAALAATTVITPGLSKATTVHYIVRGSWSNPSWQQAR